jgi:hypothetical protein
MEEGERSGRPSTRKIADDTWDSLDAKEERNDIEQKGRE